jgi:phospholipid/cholesterol/gamma-HCH transport system permease protein
MFQALQQRVISLSEQLGILILSFFENAGVLFFNLKDSLVYIARGEMDLKKLIAQTALIGFDSLIMSVLICTIAGSVLALQSAQRFAQSGATAYVGGLVALAIVREIAPIFTCLAVGARAGTAIAAEIANMQVSEQVDALRILRINPIRYLMVPRLLACVCALPMLTMIGAVVAIAGGMVVAQTVTGLHYSKFLESVWLSLKPSDVRISLFKSMIFGIILATISCTIGLNTRGGAKDVGLATTRAVIWISIVIIIADFLLTWVFFGPKAGE